MLTDLLSTNNVESYNCKLASMIGLKESIYIQQLINIDERANRKDKLNSGGFFLIDRDYVTRRTTIRESEQREIDAKLSSLGVVEISGDTGDLVKINLDCVTAMFVSENEAIVGKLKSPVTKREKKDIIKDKLKMSVNERREDRRSAYYDWIDAVYEKDGWMSKEAVLSGQRVVDMYSSGKDDIAIKIIKIAALNGYRDMTWAVNALKREYENMRKQNSIRISSSPVESTVSSGFGEEEF